MLFGAILAAKTQLSPILNGRIYNNDDDGWQNSKIENEADDKIAMSQGC